MFLVRLIYASKITESFEPSDIESILYSARTNNAKVGVTGLLCFNNHYFLQCLEGSREAVNQTYSHIIRDSRHEGVMLLDYQEILERDFNTWSMGYVSSNQLNTDINLKFSGTPGFNPYEMSGESCHRMMAELHKSVNLVC